MAGLRSPSEGAGLEVRLLHAAALERTSPRPQRGHSAGPGHSARGGTGTNRGGDDLPGWRRVRRPGCVAAAAEPLPGRRIGGRLRAAHESPRPSLSVPRRAALRRLASRRRAAAGRRGRRVATHTGAARMRPGRLGGARRGRAGGPAAGPGRVPEPEQEGRPRPSLRTIRAAAVGGERDAADRRRRPRQRLPDRPAAAQEAVLTEDRAAGQALQALLPDREDPGGGRECVRVRATRRRRRRRLRVSISVTSDGDRWWRSVCAGTELLRGAESDGFVYAMGGRRRADSRRRVDRDDRRMNSFSLSSFPCTFHPSSSFEVHGATVRSRSAPANCSVAIFSSARTSRPSTLLAHPRTAA